MSNRRKIASKRRHRQRRNRAARKVSIDFECVPGAVVEATELGTRVHMLLENNPEMRESWLRGHFHDGPVCFFGDSHIGQGNHQLMTYARAAGLDSYAVITGGDLIHEFGVTDYSANIERSREIMEDFSKRLAEAMSPKLPPWCVFCKRHHEGGDTCMGHHP